MTEIKDKVMDDPTQVEKCPSCNGEGYSRPYMSNCCTASMRNWPDSDLCSLCHEHSEPIECEDCDGSGEVSPEKYKELMRDYKNMNLL